MISRSPIRLRSRPGLTLLELMVSAAVSAIVLASGHVLFASALDGAEQLLRHVTRLDREANGERTLRALFARLEVGADSTMTFRGDASSMQLTSWCEVPEGWLERCVVTVRLEPIGAEDASGPDRRSAGSAMDSTAVRVDLSTGERLTLLSVPTPAEFRYLAGSEGGGRWLRIWGFGTVAPLAVGVTSRTGTVILRIGERG